MSRSVVIEARIPYAASSLERAHQRGGARVLGGHVDVERRVVLGHAGPDLLDDVELGVGEGRAAVRRVRRHVDHRVARVVPRGAADLVAVEVEEHLPGGVRPGVQQEASAVREGGRFGGAARRRRRRGVVAVDVEEPAGLVDPGGRVGGEQLPQPARGQAAARCSDIEVGAQASRAARPWAGAASNAARRPSGRRHAAPVASRPAPAGRARSRPRPATTGDADRTGNRVTARTTVTSARIDRNATGRPDVGAIGSDLVDGADDGQVDLPGEVRLGLGHRDRGSYHAGRG